MPNIPVGAIVGGLGATAALGGVGYLGYHSVYSGEYGASRNAGGGRRPTPRDSNTSPPMPPCPLMPHFSPRIVLT